jgi:hypothetical protein
MAKSKRISVYHKELENKDLLLSLEEIQKKLRVLFKAHIGETNGITGQYLFERILNRHPDEMDMFKRLFWWRCIKNQLATLRHEGVLFVINKNGKWFVMQSQKECNYFKAMLDREIKGLQKAKLKADAWVTEKTWEKI